MKFKIGDKVIVPKRNDITDILADNLQELADGSDVPNQSVLEDILWNKNPLRVKAIEQGGYELQIDHDKGKTIYGIHPEDTLTKWKGTLCPTP